MIMKIQAHLVFAESVYIWSMRSKRIWSNFPFLCRWSGYCDAYERYSISSKCTVPRFTHVNTVYLLYFLTILLSTKSTQLPTFITKLIIIDSLLLFMIEFIPRCLKFVRKEDSGNETRDYCLTFRRQFVVFVRNLMRNKQNTTIKMLTKKLLWKYKLTYIMS